MMYGGCFYFFNSYRYTIFNLCPLQYMKTSNSKINMPLGKPLNDFCRSVQEGYANIFIAKSSGFQNTRTITNLTPTCKNAVYIWNNAGKYLIEQIAFSKYDTQ